MALGLAENQAISEIAAFLYSYLPGKAHPYAHQALSFAGAADALRLGRYWVGGSKQPAIAALLEGVLDNARGQFCSLVVEIVRRGIQYRSSKGNPITREEMEILNVMISRLHFRIPELTDRAFLDALPSSEAHPETKSGKGPEAETLAALRESLLALTSTSPQERGYAFERLLNGVFEAFLLAPRGAFRVTGEQIDGSFEIDHDTYLVEARWRNEPARACDLYVLHGKVDGKAAWSRGLFVSHSGFSPDALTAYQCGRATRLIGLSGEDLYYVLDGRMSLPDALRRKARCAAETGRFYVSVYDLAP